MKPNAHRCHRTRGSLWWMLLMLGGFIAGTDAGDLRCGSQVVTSGMTATEVVSRCGVASFVDTWPPADPRLSGGKAIEQWTYNFGYGRLLQVMQFGNQRLQRIDDDGYGFAPQSPPDCDASWTPGAGKYRLLAACGEPQSRLFRGYLLRAPAQRAGMSSGGALELIAREQWTYDLGPRRLLRTVNFENGRIVDVITGARGP